MSVFDLTNEQIAQIEADCEALIAADSTSVQIWCVASADPGFDGPALLFAPIFVGQYDATLSFQPTSEILEPGCDGVADVAGDRSVDFGLTPELKKTYRAVVDGRNYRIRHVQHFGVGGAKTFTRLQLKREYP